MRICFPNAADKRLRRLLPLVTSSQSRFSPTKQLFSPSEESSPRATAIVTKKMATLPPIVNMIAPPTNLRPGVNPSNQLVLCRLCPFPVSSTKINKNNIFGFTWVFTQSDYWSSNMVEKRRFSENFDGSSHYERSFFYSTTALTILSIPIHHRILFKNTINAWTPLIDTFLHNHQPNSLDHHIEISNGWQKNHFIFFFITFYPVVIFSPDKVRSKVKNVMKMVMTINSIDVKLPESEQQTTDRQKVA